MSAERDPARLLDHAAAAGDRRLVALLVARLYPGARRTLLAVRRRLGL